MYLVQVNISTRLYLEWFWNMSVYSAVAWQNTTNHWYDLIWKVLDLGMNGLDSLNAFTRTSIVTMVISCRVSSFKSSKHLRRQQLLTMGMGWSVQENLQKLDVRSSSYSLLVLQICSFPQYSQRLFLASSFFTFFFVCFVGHSDKLLQILQLCRSHIYFNAYGYIGLQFQRTEIAPLILSLSV